MGLQYLFKSNFTRIAENITKYYLELTRNYNNRFNDEVALLTTVGALNAQTYVFVEDSIDLDTISHIAKQAVSKEESEPAAYRKIASQVKFERLRTKSTVDKITSFLDEKDELYEDILFNFIFSLEVEIFKIDNTRFSRSEIELACYEKANTIHKAINRTKKSYKGERSFTLATISLMESSQFGPVRKQLGIKN